MISPRQEVPHKQTAGKNRLLSHNVRAKYKERNPSGHGIPVSNLTSIHLSAISCATKTGAPKKTRPRHRMTTRGPRPVKPRLVTSGLATFPLLWPSAKASQPPHSKSKSSDTWRRRHEVEMWGTNRAARSRKTRISGSDTVPRQSKSSIHHIEDTNKKQTNKQTDMNTYIHTCTYIHTYITLHYITLLT